MEFWGVEVKAGEPVKAEPTDDCIIHLSHVVLGEVKKDKPNESVILFAKIGDQKLVLGTLSTHNNQQISFDLVFDREVELSHNWKNGSVYFLGYEVETQGEIDSSDDSDEEQAMELETESGVQSLEEKKGPASAAVQSNTAKPESSKQKSKSVQIKDVKADESDDDDSDSVSDDEGDSSDDGSDEEGMSVEEDSDDDEDDESDSDEETPKKAEKDNKRPKDSATKTPVPSKKQKQATPQKTDAKKSVHIATPHPAKKTSANGTNTKAQTPKSAGNFKCVPCDRSFGSEVALQSHSKAKHGAK